MMAVNYLWGKQWQNLLSEICFYKFLLLVLQIIYLIVANSIILQKLIQLEKQLFTLRIKLCGGSENLLQLFTWCHESLVFLCFRLYLFHIQKASHAYHVKFV